MAAKEMYKGYLPSAKKGIKPPKKAFHDANNKTLLQRTLFP
jgi:hypothetical protein